MKLATKDINGYPAEFELIKPVPHWVDEPMTLRLVVYGKGKPVRILWVGELGGGYGSRNKLRRIALRETKRPGFGAPAPKLEPLVFDIKNPDRWCRAKLFLSLGTAHRKGIVEECLGEIDGLSDGAIDLITKHLERHWSI